MLRSFKHIMIMAAILVIAAFAVAVCGGEDDDDGGDDTGPTATVTAPSETLAPSSPDPSLYCSDEAVEQSVESIFSSIKLTAEQRGLSVEDEEGLRKDSRTALDHLCAASTPYASATITTYCEDLIVAIENNIGGDGAKKAEFMDFYRNASCG
jgi:hypothetical protein